MKNYNVILFDLDGTLINSKLGTINSYKHTLNQFDIFENNEKELEKFIGPPIKENFNKYFKDDNNKIELAITYYRNYFLEKGIDEIQLYENVIDLLKYLNDKNKKIILATSRLTFIAKKMLDKFQLTNYFFDIIGSNFDDMLNEKAKIINHIIKKYNFNKINLIMIGDKEFDIIGANKNNIDSIAVLYGFGNINKLEKYNPTYYVNTVNDIKKII